MALAGELLSLVVSLTQEICIVVGVGALTTTLVGHLLSLHAHHSETIHGYVRAARQLRALMLALIIISGGAAILIHFQAGTYAVLVAPAFLFKWLLIALLAIFYFTELKVEGVARDATEGFEGANWYALFIVHTLAPVVSWAFLLSLYAGWLATFAVIWTAFVWLMRHQSTLKPAAASASVAPAPAPVAPPAPAPLAPPPARPAPPAQKKIEIHPNHSMLPMVAELDLPAPHPAPAPVPKPAPAPAPVPAAPAPVPPTKVEIVAEPSAPAVMMSNLEESGLPALHVMPKRPEDIESSKRGPVVKMGEE